MGGRGGEEEQKEEGEGEGEGRERGREEGSRGREGDRDGGRGRETGRKRGREHFVTGFAGHGNYWQEVLGCVEPMFICQSLKHGHHLGFRQANPNEDGLVPFC